MPKEKDKEIYMEDVHRIAIKIDEKLGEILKENFPQIDEDDFTNIWENDCFESVVEILDKELKVGGYRSYN